MLIYGEYNNMSKKKYPTERSVLQDQTNLVKRLYADWDKLAVDIERLNRLIKSKVFKKFSFRKKISIRLQRFYMKRYFKCLDDQILLEVLGDKA